MITPLDKGSLVHDGLERLPLDVLDRPIAERPEPGQPWTPADHALLQEIGGALCDQYEARGPRGPPHLLDPRPAPHPRRPRRHPRRRLRPPHHPRHRAAVRRARVRVHRASRSTRWRSRCPTGARCGCAAASTASTSPPTAPSTSSTTRPARYHQGYQRPARAATPSAAARSCSSRSTASPAASPRATPTAPGARRVLVRHHAGAASPAAATTSPTTCSSARSRCSTSSSRGVDDGVFPPHPPALSTFFRIACHVCDPDGLGTAELRKQWDAQARRPRPARATPTWPSPSRSGPTPERHPSADEPSTLPLRSTDTGPSSLTTMTVAVGSSKL